MKQEVMESCGLRWGYGVVLLIRGHLGYLEIMFFFSYDLVKKRFMVPRGRQSTQSLSVKLSCLVPNIRGSIVMRSWRRQLVIKLKYL